MLKLFPSFRRRGEKAPLLDRSKMTVKSRVEYGEDWIPHFSDNSTVTADKFLETPVPFVVVRNNEFTYTTNRIGSTRILEDDDAQRKVSIQQASSKGPTVQPPLESSFTRGAHTQIKIVPKLPVSKTVTNTKAASNNFVHDKGRSQKNIAVIPTERSEGLKNVTRNEKLTCNAKDATCMRSFQFFPLLTKAAAIIIQSCYRRFQARLYFNYYSNRWDNNNSIVLYKAARQDQRQWIYYRSTYHSPKAHAYDHISFVVETSAKRIQRVWRQYHVRSKIYSSKKEQDHCWIQPEQSLYYYFHYSDKGVTRSQDLTVAAITIQRIWRGCNAASNFHLYFVLQSIIRMQTFLRGCLARKQVMIVAATGASDDNESFDILEADEVWLDSFDPIVEEEIPTHIQTLSFLSLHPIQEGDDETETHDPGSTVTSTDHNNHNISSVQDHYYSTNVSSSNNNCKPSTQFLFHCPQEGVTSWDIDDQYDDPPIYTDDISEASLPCRNFQVRDYKRSMEEDRATISIPTDYCTMSEEAYLTQLDERTYSRAQPVSPPQISRTTEATEDNQNPFKQTVTMPFHSAHTHSIGSTREQPNYNLRGQSTQVSEHRRSSSDDDLQHVGIAAVTNTIPVGEEEAAVIERHVRGRHLRIASDSNLYYPMKKNVAKRPSVANNSYVVMTSESPTSILGTTRKV